jgi:NitT/TauT family transport system substrate-binding protein
MKPRILRFATGLAVIALVGACSGGTNPSASSAAGSPAAATAAPSAAAGSPAASAASAAPTTAPSAAAGPPEKASITVGILPIVDVATVQTAISKGLFTAQGLTVKTEVMQGGAAAIPALVGGDLDIAFGAWPSFLAANQQGIPLRAIADGVAAKPGFTQILAMPGSPLEGKPAGLAGKKVAVNTLNNLGELAVRSTLKQAGGDPAAVTLIEIPFPDMGAALQRGDVDAIWAVEPGVTNAKKNLKAVVVADSYVGPMDAFPVAGFQATAVFATANPNTVAAFQRAIFAAATATQDDATARASIAQYTTLPPELIASVTLPEYRGAIDPAQLKRVYDYLVEFGILQSGLDVGSLILASP